MLYIVLVLVLAAFGLLATALVTSTMLWAWGSVAASVLAAAVLVIDWVRRSKRRPEPQAPARRPRRPATAAARKPVQPSANVAATASAAPTEALEPTEQSQPAEHFEHSEVSESSKHQKGSDISEGSDGSEGSEGSDGPERSDGWEGSDGSEGPEGSDGPEGSGISVGSGALDASGGSVGAEDAEGSDTSVGPVRSVDSEARGPSADTRRPEDADWRATVVIPDPGTEPGEEDTDAADLLVVSELDDQVWVIDERPRYHLDDCEWVGDRETMVLPVREARQLGFTPCAVCAPDEELAAGHRASKAKG